MSVYSITVWFYYSAQDITLTFSAAFLRSSIVLSFFICLFSISRLAFFVIGWVSTGMGGATLDLFSNRRSIFVFPTISYRYKLEVRSAEALRFVGVFFFPPRSITNKSSFFCSARSPPKALSLNLSASSASSIFV